MKATVLNHKILCFFQTFVVGITVFLTLTAVRVFRSQIEEAIFTAIAALTVHIFFTDTLTGQRVTHNAISRTSWVAVTC